MESNKDAVVFKVTADGFNVVIDEMADNEEIKRVLSEKTESMTSFFDGGNAKITFVGKPLMSDEKEMFAGIIAEKGGVKVIIIDENRKIEKDTEEEIQRAIATRNERKPKAEAIDTSALVKKIAEEDTNLVKIHKGSMRSGMGIEFNGTVIVLGDVNPGAEIRADGNIIVLGRLKGVVHAGRKGDKEAFVAAIALRPKQLIIGDIITTFPEDFEKQIKPEYAYIKDDVIYVEDL